MNEKPEDFGTPWRTEAPDMHMPHWLILDKDDEYISDVPCGVRAAFIVRAVNSYDDMLAALKDAQQQLAFWQSCCDRGSGATMPRSKPSEAVVDRIRAAIARAEETP